MQHYIVDVAGKTTELFIKPKLTFNGSEEAKIELAEQSGNRVLMAKSTLAMARLLAPSVGCSAETLATRRQRMTWQEAINLGKATAANRKRGWRFMEKVGA